MMSCALRVLREAVVWRDAQAYVRRASGEEVPVQAGLMDATHVEVLSGLAEGDEVRLP